MKLNRVRNKAKLRYIIWCYDTEMYLDEGEEHDD